jgi:hypothetical protein
LSRALQTNAVLAEGAEAEAAGSAEAVTANPLVADFDAQLAQLKEDDFTGWCNLLATASKLVSFSVWPGPPRPGSAMQRPQSAAYAVLHAGHHPKLAS